LHNPISFTGLLAKTTKADTQNGGDPSMLVILCQPENFVGGEFQCACRQIPSRDF